MDLSGVLPGEFRCPFALGELLLSWYGYIEDQSAPFWPTLGAAGPALLVFSLPGIVAVDYGRRAVNGGIRAGMTPAIIGGALAFGVIELNVAAAAPCS